jgi:hypothetical protein
MKIEWLNDRRTKALITRGWFRKRQAEVFLYCEGGHWYYTELGGYRVGPHLSYWLQLRLDSARKNGRSAWKPVSKLPSARVV